MTTIAALCAQFKKPSAPAGFTSRERSVLARAMDLLERRRLRKHPLLNNDGDVAIYLLLRFAGLAKEQVHGLFLDAEYRLIAAEVLFHGTVNACSFHHRDLAIAAVKHQAVHVVLSHNHPSNNPVPSDDDIECTAHARHMLGLLGVSLLEHFVVTATGITGIQRFIQERATGRLAVRQEANG